MMGAEDGRRKCVLSTLDWEQLQVRAVGRARVRRARGAADGARGR